MRVELQTIESIRTQEEICRLPAEYIAFRKEFGDVSGSARKKEGGCAALHVVKE
jgi:hypothetical protein